MLKIDINNFNLTFFLNKYLYIFTKSGNTIIIKEIYENEKVKIINFINIINESIKIYSKKYYNNTLLSTNIIIGKEKEELLNRVNNSLDNSIAKDFINKNKFNNKLKNILISDGTLALSNNSIRSISNNYFILDILNLDTNSIIGSIIIMKNDININVDDDYLADSLKLLNKFTNLFLKEEKYNKVKRLINSML